MTPSTPAEWVLRHAQQTPHAPAIATPTHRLTYAGLAARALAFAGHLREHGVSRGARVLIALPNGPAAVVASLAVQALGACAVEVSRETSQAALFAIIAQCGSRHAVVHLRDHAFFSGVPALRHLWLLQPGKTPRALPDGRSSWIHEDGSLDCATAIESPVAVEPGDAALIVFTSGSTGVPRGVVQTVNNIWANTRSIVSYLELTARDRAMAILPLSYCYGKSVLQTHLYAGGSVFFDNRFMYPRVVLEAIAAEECTGFAGVPLTYELIRRQLESETLSFPSLRYLTQAGGAMAPDTIRWARSAFAPARLYVMYGQTEATARLSYLPPEHAVKKAGSIGIAIPGVELRVVDECDRELPAGESGELVARGDNVTPGYLGAPEETAQLLRNGWLHTGDLARRDGDGFFYIVGRAKEILKIGGFRISPVEIEQALAKHESVLEAAVVGRPRALEGEAAVACVVLREGRAASEHELRAFCRSQLAAHLVPSEIRFVRALPRNEAGKLRRRELAAQIQSTSGGDDVLEERAATGS